MNYDVPNKDKFEISPEFIEAVERSKLDADYKSELLLTKAGLKPATEIELPISLKTEEGTNQYLTEDDILEIIELIKNSGLFYKIGERKIIEGTYGAFEAPGKPAVRKPSTAESIQTFIANSQEQLDALAKVWGTEDDEAIGLALGIPRSAVEAFAGKREQINLHDLPEEVQNKEAAAFLTPTLSRDNWQEEMKVGHARAAFIKKTCPKIYDELMGRKPGVTHD
ncbi:MAG: hypothetical protein CO141_03305 [Candidatus Moranbacteria bacterium CG_4_9_14_3_um_filter_42_9]|nr:MAG: hypothetical protein CO141_03305 [Candidatus Moranbacteria bacterium CG_4_9_14_3_um_filter_42_9]